LFQSQKDVELFKGSQGAAEVLRQVISEHFGVKVKYKARIAESAPPPPAAPVIEPTAPEEFTSEEEFEDATEAIPVQQAKPVADERAGEFVLREILGAEQIKGEQ
jgi:DNA polymerase III subunit gamma/tau